MSSPEFMGGRRDQNSGGRPGYAIRRSPVGRRSFPQVERHAVFALACHPHTELTATRTHRPLRGPARGERALGAHEKTQGHILERLPRVCDPSVRRCHLCHLRNALRFGLFNQGPAIDQPAVIEKILNHPDL